MTIQSAIQLEDIIGSEDLPANRNVLYGQAGGVSAVINTTAAGVIETVRAFPEIFGTCYATLNGIQGVLEEHLTNVCDIPETEIARLKHLPGAAFGACRFDLDPLEHNPAQYERVLEVFRAYEIGFFLYNGGNGSMVTALKVADYCKSKGHDVRCIGVAKTIDNDLAMSYCSPGFGSAAKYLATSFCEATMDILAMHQTSSKFFVMEAMGRDVGWLALSGAMVKKIIPDAPVILLPAEKSFDKDAFLKKLDHLIATKGYCVCMVSEGVRDLNGDYLSIAGIEHTHERDYTQLGGAGKVIANMVSEHLGCKVHFAIPDYLQRSAAHCVSGIDWQMAYDAGKASVVAALRGEHGTLPVIVQTQESPFKYSLESVDLVDVADLELKVTDDYLSDDGMDVSDKGFDYIESVIQGEKKVPYQNGIPDYRPLTIKMVEPKLSVFKADKY